MPLGDVVCHHYCSGSGSWHRPTNLLFKRLGDPQAFGVVIIRRKCRFEDYVQQQSPRAVLDMSCGGHVRSNTTHQCVHRYCAPPAGFGVTISTIVSFTCVLGHSRTVSHGAYCVEADPSSPVLVKASLDQCRQPRTLAAVHTHCMEHHNRSNTMCLQVFNETVQKGSPGN
jgi:hypothetical protein